MPAAVVELLRSVARQRGTISYRALARAAGLDIGTAAGRNDLARILREVSTREVAAGRPMLSAVVLFRAGKRPGRGFFALAKSLGRFDGGSESQFFSAELRRVRDFWGARS